MSDIIYRVIEEAGEVIYTAVLFDNDGYPWSEHVTGRGETEKEALTDMYDMIHLWEL